MPKINKAELRRVHELKAAGLTSGEVAEKLKMSLKRANTLYMTGLPPGEYLAVQEQFSAGPVFSPTRVWKAPPRGRVYHVE